MRRLLWALTGMLWLLACAGVQATIETDGVQATVFEAPSQDKWVVVAELPIVVVVAGLRVPAVLLLEVAIPGGVTRCVIESPLTDPVLCFEPVADVGI